jgi:hypothetical protein
MTSVIRGTDGQRFGFSAAGRCVLSEAQSIIVRMNINLVLLLLGLVGVYLVASTLWPYTKCGGCKGGKQASPTGRYWRACGRCGGKGRRRRLGAVLLGRNR